MNGREYFHESAIRDIVDVLTSLKDYDEVELLSNSKNKRSFKSITSATKDLILTFPVMVSSDVDIETAMAFAKAHEKKCASLLHMLFLAINVGSNEDVYDYVKKFHKNAGSLNGTFDDWDSTIDDIADLMDESAGTYKIDHEVLEAVMQDLKESNYTLPDDVDPIGLDEYSIIPAAVTKAGDRIVCEGRNNNRPIIVPNAGSVRFDGDANTTVNYIGGGAPTGGGSAADNSKRLKDNAELINKTILDTQYKKANEMQPTMMIVNFNQTSGDDNSKTCITQAIIGVKAKIYAVSSDDICNRLSNKLSDNRLLTNFVRATTNEIAFFRDFLFAIDRAKFDALSYGKSNKSNKLWKVLERRSIKSRFRRSLKMYNDATAITTVLLSQNDVDRLMREHTINLMNVGNCRKLFDKFNLMCIAIANDATEVLTLLYDTGDDNFEKMTYSGMEREASDNSYKKMVNLMTKMTR